MFVFVLLRMISVLYPESAWCGVSGRCWQTSKHLPQKSYVWKLLIAGFLFSFKNFMEYFIYLIPGCPLSSSLKYSLNAPCLGIALHSFFMRYFTQWCLEPNRVSCCNRKIKNTYVLLFQALVFWYLWQILYSILILICQHFKINKTLEMEWLCLTVTQIKVNYSY